MHPAAAAVSPPSSSSSPLKIVDVINHLLSLLLVASLTAKSFVGRWQVLRSKLSDLKSAVIEISESPHWAENSLLHTLLPGVLSTLHRLRSLSDQCADGSFNGGKLLMQSDLDMASASLSKQLHDIDLLLRSGVLLHSSAIVLSQPGPGAQKEDLGFFIKDLFTRLQIGGIEFKKKALEALIRLLSSEDDGAKSAGLVANEGSIGYLIHMLDANNDPSIREQAALAVCVLATASDSSRKVVFEEGGLGPLLKILETGTSAMREKAAVAVEAITADPQQAWAVSAYGGVWVLIQACRSGTMAARAHAAGAIRNVSAVEDARVSLAEEGATPVVLDLLVSGTPSGKEKASSCIAILVSSSECFRAQVVQQKGLPKLLQLFNESSNCDTLENLLRALTSLSSSSDSVHRTLSSSSLFLVHLSELIKHGNIVLQQMAASLLLSLSISDGDKRGIASCMGSLVKLMELWKPAGIQEVGSEALISLLSVNSNRKELVRDEKSVMKLVHMLDPRNESVCKKFPVAVVAAIISGGGGRECRKVLVAAGAQTHMQRLAEMEVAGARRALHRLTGNRLKSIFSRSWKELPGK